ncbi:hypothetical protein WICPIJ_005184 [Wickerhamomyces pijperi]|uniref:ubiquitinyl hydrolase 1 n=1 Tax=Wickerhamomyces pijperi TaxID=599730 RepID=A0A9P8TM66_WICPI|nr:hypothetical protein WICPIJ_005184 [Wickerhamomyces pijperi]
MTESTVLPLKSSNYTPTYSDELLNLITDLYKTQIKPHEKDWVLLRLLDLIQVTEEHFEAYREHMANGQHLQCLEYYIVGVFLIYLIIPKSIQFQIKNKNYELFLTLKSLYDKETEMSNVNLQVVKYIGYIQEKENSKLGLIGATRGSEPLMLATKARSYTLPESKLLQDLSSVSSTLQKPTRMFADIPESTVASSATSTISEESTSSSTLDDLWSPPELQPNDQLRLAEDNDLVDDFMDLTLAGSPDHAKSFDDACNHPRLQHAHSFPVNIANGHLEADLDSDGYSNSFSIDEGARTDYFKTKSSHRNDSYHSIYASDEDESIPTVSSKWLFESLSEAASSFLIFDIRTTERYSINHIAFSNIISIDPTLVLNSRNYQELEDVLRGTLSREDYLKFKNIKKYEQVISYTDLQSSAAVHTDYMSKFFRMLGEKYIKNKILAGGFDSWNKFLSKNYKHTRSELKFTAKEPFLPPQIESVAPSAPLTPVQSFLSSDQRSPSPNTVPYDYTKLLPQVSMNSTAAATAAPSVSAVRPPIPLTTSLMSGQQTQTKYQQEVPVSSAPKQAPPLPPPPPPPPSHTVTYQRSVQPLPPQRPQYHHQHQHQNIGVYPHQQFSSNSAGYGAGQQFAFPQNYQHQPQPLQYQYQQQQQQQPYPSNYQTHSGNGYFQPAPRPQQIQIRNHPPKEHPLQRQRISSTSIPTIQASEKPFVRLSVTGLRNMSNTCYINSMIQCLFASTLFRDIFLENKYEEYSNPKFTKTRLSPALSLLFKKMYLNGGCSIVPSGFLKTCMVLRPDLKIPSHQQDTQEFLMFILDQLHEELSNSNAVVNDFPSLMQHDNLGKEYDTWCDGLLKQGFSPLSHIFQGQLQDSLQCMKCGYKSSNYSSFYMLSLVIPKTSVDGKKLKKITLEDCIQLFTHDEILSGENAWTCPECNKSSEPAGDTTATATATATGKETRKHRFGFGANIFKSARSRSSSPAPRSSSSKRSKLSKSSKPQLLTEDMSSASKKKSTIKSLNFVVLPPVLIIHLSRFLFYDTSQKDDSIVQYPLVLEIPFQNSTVKYRLFGVINHYGTLKSGHYTAITNKNLTHDLNRPNWYYFDDEVVKATNHGFVPINTAGAGGEAHMSSSDVYVLFYERIN